VNVEFKVLTTLSMKSADMWLVIPCSSGKSRRFGDTFYHLPLFSLLFGFHFNPEVRGYIFLRNMGLSPNYTVLQPRKPYSSKLIVVDFDFYVDYLYSCPIFLFFLT
jgi:hypothetical protein